MKTEINTSHHNKRRWGQFLKDVLVCSLGAYGGPEAHFGVLPTSWS